MLILFFLNSPNASKLCAFKDEVTCISTVIIPSGSSGSGCCCLWYPQKNGFCRAPGTPPPYFSLTLSLRTEPVLKSLQGAKMLCVLWRLQSIVWFCKALIHAERGECFLLTLLTFIKYVPEQYWGNSFISHLLSHPRGLAGRHVQVSSPGLHSDSSPPSSTKAFFLG